MSNDETTRIISRSSAPRAEQDGNATVRLDQAAGRRADSARADDDSTRIYRPSRGEGSEASSGAQGASASADTRDYAADPVVGWLVIVDGPGKGKSVNLGYGMNSIGRNASERVSLDFGDEEISRSAHAQLSYDARGRKFYLQHGGGANLTYLGDTPVLQPTLLQGGETISIGKTTLRFCPFCGPDFDWQDKL